MPQVRLKTKLMLLYMMSIISAQLLLGVESALISGIAKKGPSELRETYTRHNCRGRNMIALSPVTWLPCISWQPCDCTLEAGTAPNSRIYCPRYVTFPSYKPSGEWALLSSTTVVLWNQCRMQTGREFQSRFVMAALL